MECSVLREQRMEVLYGEADAETARRVEEHHAVCASCRDEMAALRRLRQDLKAWKVPTARATVRVRARAERFLVAAAVMLLALGGAFGLAGSEIRFEGGRLAFRLGRADGEIERRLAEQEAWHQEEIRALTASQGGGSALEEQALLRKVEEMIRASEDRQAAALTTRFAEFRQRTDTERRYDLARVAAGLSYLDGKTGQHVARTTELMGYVLEASQKR